MKIFCKYIKLIFWLHKKKWKGNAPIFIHDTEEKYKYNTFPKSILNFDLMTFSLGRKLQFLHTDILFSY